MNHDVISGSNPTEVADKYLSSSRLQRKRPANVSEVRAPRVTFMENPHSLERVLSWFALCSEGRSLQKSLANWWLLPEHLREIPEVREDLLKAFRSVEKHRKKCLLCRLIHDQGSEVLVLSEQGPDGFPRFMIKPYPKRRRKIERLPR